MLRPMSARLHVSKLFHLPIPSNSASNSPAQTSRIQRSIKMNLTGNTVFITGATSGLGRAWAESFHKLGNQVIISGRRKGHLDEVTKANPGMKSFELDVENPASIAAVCKKLIADYPKLNAVINNAGIMQIDDTSTVMDDAQASSI